MHIHICIYSCNSLSKVFASSHGDLRAEQSADNFTWWCALQYLLKHYQTVDLLVMATPQAQPEWGTIKLATQLGTKAFRCLDDRDDLVSGRVKCSDCVWMHLAIDQSLLHFDLG